MGGRQRPALTLAGRRLRRRFPHKARERRPWLRFPHHARLIAGAVDLDGNAAEGKRKDQAHTLKIALESAASARGMVPHGSSGKFLPPSSSEFGLVPGFNVFGDAKCLRR